MCKTPLQPCGVGDLAKVVPELGPFDFEHPPRTTSLWISEGLTSYVADLVLRRSGVST